MKRIMSVLAWLHVSLIAANVCVMLFEVLFFLEITGPVDDRAIFLRSLLIAIPTAISYYAVEKLPAQWQTVIASLMIAALSLPLIGNFTGPLMAAIICFFRIRGKLIHLEKRSHLDAPHPVALLVFLVSFFFSAIYQAPILQKISVLSAVLYLLILCAFFGLESITGYLEQNREIHNLPARRVMRIAGAALGTFLLLGSISMLPVAASVQGDVREEQTISQHRPLRRKHIWHDDLPLQEWDSIDAETSDDDFPVETGFILVGGGVFLLVLGLRKLRNLRWQKSANGDVIRSLADDEDVIEELPASTGSKLSIWDRSVEAKVRRKYKKLVLKSRPEPPYSWQTPAELEKERDIVDIPLHESYERVRYGGGRQ